MALVGDEMQTEHAAPLTALTIGNFDGVHIGHVELVRRARLAVGPEGRVVVLAFFPHPLSVIKPGEAPVGLTTFDQRRRTLRAMGVDEVVHLEPTRALLGTDPFTFIEELAKRWQPAVIVEGDDFRFGSRRAGDVETLASIGRQLDQLGMGFETIVLDPVQAVLTDHTVVTASSSIVRWLIARGRVGDAERVLGRPYRIEGTVVRGDQRGRTIGVPTANVETPNPLPGDGVYAGVAELPDGSRRAAAVHVGPRMTFGSEKRTLEAYVLDWNGPGSVGMSGERQFAYGWTITLDLVSWVRDQASYDSVEALLDQMRRDIERSRVVVQARLNGSAPSTEAAPGTPTESAR